MLRFVDEYETHSNSGKVKEQYFTHILWASKNYFIILPDRFMKYLHLTWQVYEISKAKKECDSDLKSLNSHLKRHSGWS